MTTAVLTILIILCAGLGITLRELYKEEKNLNDRIRNLSSRLEISNSNQVYLLTGYLTRLFASCASQDGREEALKDFSFFPSLKNKNCTILKGGMEILFVHVDSDGYRFEVGANYPEFFVEFHLISVPDLRIEDMINFLLTLPKRQRRTTEQVSV